MDKNRAWNLLEEISFVRIAGTKEELKAANILKDIAEKAGVPAVIEDFEIEGATISEATLEVLEPEYCSFPVIGIGRTVATKKDGLIAGFKYIEDGMDANLTDVKDCIVLTQGRVAPPLIQKLVEKGAVGYILDRKSVV